ncbi:MAG: DUF1320 domain-containing protein [Proteobacteria bacterium]|nr:DUF1320 domain-containing protein [Pseudomonadota bacterium]
MFATRTDLLARSNARRIAQLAVPADFDFPHSERALREIIEGGSLRRYPEKDRPALKMALDAIDKCLADADALLISYGIPPEVQTTLLARLSSTIALYYLQGAERMTKDVQDAYDAVLALLNKFQRGELPGLVPEPDIGIAEITSSPRRYG